VKPDKMHDRAQATGSRFAACTGLRSLKSSVSM
jgi:hypothetical protein